MSIYEFGNNGTKPHFLIFFGGGGVVNLVRIFYHNYEELSYNKMRLKTKISTRGGIRTRGLLLRRETRYPLRYTDF